jgi:hypothetical protein
MVPSAYLSPAEVVPEYSAPPRLLPSLSEITSSPSAPWDVAGLPGLRELWDETLGSPQICIAILDGPVDLTHPSMAGANLTQLESLVPGVATTDSASQHGTHIASVIFGTNKAPGTSNVTGITPGCRGVSIPIFESVDADSFRACSQLDLARAILQAVQYGAHVINISGGQFSPGGGAYPLLAKVIRDCIQSDILIVAATGNEGCECLHIPAALDGILAVGAMNLRGQPLAFSNWGGSYQSQGILAPGENVVGARPGGGTVARTGTSYATPIVSGIAGLLLSLQIKRGQRPSPALVRQALLRSALSCDDQSRTDCRRFLAGRLNVKGGISFITQGKLTMTETPEVQASDVAQSVREVQAGAPVPARPPEPQAIQAIPAPAPQTQPEKAPGTCGCQSRTAPQLVYALGQIGYDLVSEARLDSLAQKIAGTSGSSTPERVMAFDPHRMLAYLEQNPWDAAAIEWTLSLDGTPIYAVRPQGPFAGEAYKELRQFLHAQLTEGVERVSIPGVQAGKATLLMGQTVPVIVPDLRGMYSWTTNALVEAVTGGRNGRQASHNGRQKKQEGVRNFLHRVYHEVRNLGMLPQDRALNFAATNAFEVERIYESALKDKMDLDSINVERSPICRPGSDCWDVEVYFFYPERQVQTVRKVYRFTVDVSDTVPVTVGETRAWFTR